MAVELAPLRALVASMGARVMDVTPMPGGASTRSYFRVALDEGASAIGVHVPDGDRPEEVGKGGAAGARRWPFLEVRDLLAERGVRVPRLLGERAAEGWLLLEDLGDDTLAAHVEARPDRRASRYAQAVRDLARAQRALDPLPAGSVVASRSFDADLLLWELDHFREWGLEARGRALTEDDRQEAQGIFERLAARIAGWPRAFVHRDYQSRNLMVVGDEIAWIDFQDALLGPRVYDLVALLFDSYQDLDGDFVDARVRDYAEALALSRADREAVAREVLWVSVQRKLKDAGRFVFIDRVKGNPAFLPYVGPTLQKVSRSLDGLAATEPDMARLRAILARALPGEVGT